MKWIAEEARWHEEQGARADLKPGDRESALLAASVAWRTAGKLCFLLRKDEERERTFREKADAVRKPPR
jgi:hypothetical protein